MQTKKGAQPLPTQSEPQPITDAIGTTTITHKNETTNHYRQNLNHDHPPQNRDHDHYQNMAGAPGPGLGAGRPRVQWVLTTSPRYGTSYEASQAGGPETGGLSVGAGPLLADTESVNNLAGPRTQRAFRFRPSNQGSSHGRQEA